MAYIAGFLDGDGSLMLQIKARADTRRGVRFMATICFYQDTRHEAPLLWIRKIFGIGYVSRRRDGMSELRINGFKQVLLLLRLIEPYVRFKKKQVSLLIEACTMLVQKKMRLMSKSELKKLVDLAFALKRENYTSNSSHTKEEVLSRLGLTP